MQKVGMFLEDQKNYHAAIVWYKKALDLALMAYSDSSTMPEPSGDAPGIVSLLQHDIGQKE